MARYGRDSTAPRRAASALATNGVEDVFSERKPVTLSRETLRQKSDHLRDCGRRRLARTAATGEMQMRERVASIVGLASSVTTLVC